MAMTLHPKNYWEVPKETVRVARASFPKGNVYMKMYDELGTLYKDKDFVDLFPVINKFPRQNSSKNAAYWVSL
ncbi:hypothetical protein [Coleofasciculus sp. E1-EBD-02]|uniref:hypothetical protein n=1 Tax=Coleofasciculus sp. E1-EBD-02 TaxID=3068481 RepID=UPI0032FA7204